MDADARSDRVTGSPPGEDDRLVRRLREGDATAVDELWRRFGGRLLAYAAARLDGDEDLAEDVMVQALAAAVRSAGRFDSRRSNLAAWVYGIARRIIHLELRTQRRRSAVPAAAETPLDEAANAAVKQDLAGEVAAHLEAKRRVRVLASVLTATEMEVLVLHFVDEFSIKEIARIVGRSRRGVDSLLQRAKQKARERLAKDGD